MDSTKSEVVSMDKIEKLMRQLLNEQEERLRNTFKEEMEKLSSRVDNLETNNINNKNDIKNLQKEIKDIEEGLHFQEEVFDKKIDELHDRTDDVNSECDEIWDKMRQLEDRNRRNNLRIVGLEEHENETSSDVEEKVINLFKDKLKITKDIEIDRAHRTGPKRNKSRPIVLKLLRYKDKLKILKEAHHLQNSGIWINEDFSKATVDIRKGLLVEIKRRKASGEKGLILVYDKIKKKTRTGTTSQMP